VTRVLALHPLSALELARASHFTWDPWGLAAVVPATVLYAVGLGVLWSRAGTGGGIRPWQVSSYAAGVLVLVLALLSPLDALSDLRFSAHMSQHELLMVFAAPLMVLGRPLYVYLWALPQRGREAVGRALAVRSVKTGLTVLTAPLFALALHAVFRWVWHIPALFDGAMENDALHAFQHFTFFASAALFWWTIIHGRYGRAGYGVSLLFVFATALHTSLLAALLTLSPHGAYTVYADRGLETPEELVADQALGGALMWVPSGVTLLASGLALFTAWLGEAERRARRAEVRRAAVSRPPHDAGALAVASQPEEST